MKRAIVCFTRIPVPGQTKTRLMPILRGEECAALHTAFLRDMAAVFKEEGSELFVAHTPGEGWEMMKEIFPFAKDFFPQEGADLGERMCRALTEVLQRGYDSCVLVGSDLPLMTAAHLQSGFSALESADVTLGPTSDGGYYLVGMKKPCRELFEKQSYGTGSVYENTKAAAEKAGYRVAPALACDDVDTPEDLRALYRLLKGGTSDTWRCLHEIFAEEKQRC